MPSFTVRYSMLWTEQPQGIWIDLVAAKQVKLERHNQHILYIILQIYALMDTRSILLKNNRRNEWLKQSRNEWLKWHRNEWLK